MVDVDVEVQTAARGPLPPGVLEYAQDKVARVAKFAARPVRFASVSLTVTENPSVDRPFTAEAVIDVDGRVVRAHVDGHEGREAIDLLESRLRRRVGALAARPRKTAAGSLAPMPLVGEGAARWRHPSLALEPLSVEEAAFDLDQLGLDFYLFIDLATGNDALVWRRNDGQLVREEAPPALSEDDAVERLELSLQRFVFYRDESTGRGRVAYRCNDGRVGIVLLD